jgi:hypothetical protein
MINASAVVRTTWKSNAIIKYVEVYANKNLTTF